MTSAATSSLTLTAPELVAMNWWPSALEARHELVGVSDGAHRRDGINAQVRAHEQRLRVGVGDAAHGARAGELGQVVLELGAERRVLDRVDLAVEPAARAA